MKIAVIEDDARKGGHIEQFLGEVVPDAEILRARSFSSGRRLLTESVPDLIVLDMSMPTFDIVGAEKGGRARAFAGRDILDEISDNGISAKVVVVTQFDFFGEGADRKTLREVRRELRERFRDIYLGTIFYSPASSAWKAELEAVLQKALRGKA